MGPTSFADRARVAVERFSIQNLTYALLAAVLLAAIVAALTLQASPTYQTNAVLLIDSPLALAASGDEGTVTKLAHLRGKYATLADTEVIAGPVAAELGLTLDDVTDRTDVSPPPSTLSLVVTARGDTAEEAEELADAMAAGISEFVAQEHEDNSVPAPNRFVIEVVQDADPAVQIAPSAKRALAGAGVVFLLALGLAYLALQLFRPPVPAGERLSPE